MPLGPSPPSHATLGLFVLSPTLTAASICCLGCCIPTSWHDGPTRCCHGQRDQARVVQRPKTPPETRFTGTRGCLSYSSGPLVRLFPFHNLFLQPSPFLTSTTTTTTSPTHNNLRHNLLPRNFEAFNVSSGSFLLFLLICFPQISPPWSHSNIDLPPRRPRTRSFLDHARSKDS